MSQKPQELILIILCCACSYNSMSFLCTRLVYINYFVLNVSSVSPFRVRLFSQVLLTKWHCWLSPLSDIVR